MKLIPVILLYPNNLSEKLEFHRIQQWVEELCYSELGRNVVSQMRVMADLDLIHLALQQTLEFKGILQWGQAFPAQYYHSLDQILKRIEIDGYVLGAEDFLKIKQHQQAIAEVFDFFKKHPDEYPVLRKLLIGLSYEKAIREKIHLVVDDEGVVRSDASAELMRIRKQIQSKTIQIEKVFRQIVQRLIKAGKLGETIESIRNGRRVLAVLAEHKRSVRGITLDESDSGKTFFIEPEETVLLSNEVFELEREEQREVQRILKELGNQIRPYVSLLRDYQILLGDLDYIRAKARLALSTHSVLPRIQEGDSASFIDAYHPVLRSVGEKQHKEIIPLELEFNNGQRLILVSGPNAGGKSVSLKTVGLLQMMLQSGLLVPCDERSRFRIYRKIMADIGDEQSIENELSTYSSRLKNLKFILEQSDQDSLILIDEFGSGTDPKLGGAIAESALTELLRRKSYGIITTHFSRLKAFAENNKGIINASMSFDEEALQPLYKMNIGKPGSSYTFSIARRIGLPKPVIDRAQSLAGTDTIKVDKLLINVEKEKEKVERQSDLLEKENLRLRELIQKFEKQNEELELMKKQLKFERRQSKLDLIEKTEQRLNQMMKELRDKAKDETKLKAIQSDLASGKAQLKEEIRLLDQGMRRKAIDQNIQIGSIVKMYGGTERGTVTEIKKEKAVVEFGNIKTTVALSELEVVAEEKKDEIRRKAAVRDIDTIAGMYEIDLRGKRVEEADEELEKYFDKALLISIAEVKILHGKGSGVLKSYIHQKLRRLSFVESFHHPDERQGGSGVTIVKFK